MKFDQKTFEHLGYYVYMLLDDRKVPFYVGKGNRNRVFDHLACALKDDTVNNKYETIRRIERSGRKVGHVILRHGLTEDMALAIEATLIDALEYLSFPLTNLASGHHSSDLGLMTAGEIIGKYNAKPLRALEHPVVIININKTYKMGSGPEGLYQATRKAWVVGKSRRDTVRYALSEYRGLIAEVFEINDWFPIEEVGASGKTKTRWGFNGSVAPDEVRRIYINRSIAHTKKRGASNPIRYCLGADGAAVENDPQYDPIGKYTSPVNPGLNTAVTQGLREGKLKIKR